MMISSYIKTCNITLVKHHLNATCNVPPLVIVGAVLITPLNLTGHCQAVELVQVPKSVTNS